MLDLAMITHDPAFVLAVITSLMCLLLMLVPHQPGG